MRTGLERSWRHPAQVRRLGAVFVRGLAGGLALAVFGCLAAENTRDLDGKIDFDRDIRPILSENCYKCHGPDEGSRKAKLRFDVRADALKPAKSGLLPIVPGAPERSELIARVTASDPDDRMPPAQSGKTLAPVQIDRLRRWIAQGAPYTTHWAYVKPVRPPIPQVQNHRWPRNALDRFILARLERDRLSPSPQADRYTLIRRAFLDLIGLPPTPEEVARFVTNDDPHAYEALVDRLLAREAFGEHWARMWLDLARYADSAGYADDPPRTIWAYRDYVIRSFNANKPFDRFTLEQIAGDLLPDPTEDDLIATAFHRNTMTNNEGGTDDEEFRNAAIVDRANTTMAVWMGTSLACAQCHNHKYDPISQQDYFRFFAIFNNTADADRPDENPTLQTFTPDEKAQKVAWQAEIDRIEQLFAISTPQSLAGLAKWAQAFPAAGQWRVLQPSSLKSPATNAGSAATGELETNAYTFEFSLPVSRLTGLRLETLNAPAPADATQNLDSRDTPITNVTARILPAGSQCVSGRFLRVALPGKNRILSLAEVQVFSGSQNLSPRAKASQSSTAYDGVARLAIDGNTDGHYDKNTTTHTETSENPWWELDLGQARPIDRIVIWNRTDNGLYTRLSDFQLSLLDEARNTVWQLSVKEPPNPSSQFSVDGAQSIDFAAGADLSGQPWLKLRGQVEAQNKGTGIGRLADGPEPLILLPTKPVVVPAGSRLQVDLEPAGKASPASLRFAVCDADSLAAFAGVSLPVLRALAQFPSASSERQHAGLLRYYRAEVDPSLAADRNRLKDLQKQLSELKPTTVPIMRELAGQKRRKTHIQFRGNFLALGDEVSEGLPAAFHHASAREKPTRLDVAHWLVDENNPLTARVLANRFWEQIFGVGIVRTSEDFGSQGDRPTNPELLDWLACDLVASHWDVKAFLKLLVTSATYCQSSRVTPELLERDPDNLLLARGPRFRMSAEVVRDQALALSGLLSRKMYGPPVRPPRPSLGLSAAFGGSLDWKTSEGEDRYRRAIYTEWRRTSPYPSMATFDAPNREVCTLRRPRSNTPLQALVTLNDPVFFEAAQGIGRRLANHTGSVADKASYGIRLCLARPPRNDELQHLVGFYEEVRATMSLNREQAKRLAAAKDETLPPHADVTELAAWTAVGNVLLNLDETLMRP